MIWQLILRLNSTLDLRSTDTRNEESVKQTNYYRQENKAHAPPDNHIL